MCTVHAAPQCDIKWSWVCISTEQNFFSARKSTAHCIARLRIVGMVLDAWFASATCQGAAERVGDPACGGASIRCRARLRECSHARTKLAVRNVEIRVERTIHMCVNERVLIINTFIIGYIYVDLLR